MSSWRKSVGADCVAIGANEAETLGDSLRGFWEWCLVGSALFEADFSDAFFFFFGGGGRESPAEESRPSRRGEGAEPDVDLLEGVGP